MRISDLMLSNGFVNTAAQTKQRIQKLSLQISSGQKVQKPSDDPGAAAKILRLGNQLNQNGNYSKNVDNGLAFVNETTFALQSVQTETSGILSKLIELNNSVNMPNYKTYADQIDLSLKSILDSANSQSDGKYIFGGTDFASSPYGYTADDSSIETKISNSSGKQIVKVSSSIYQKINMTGSEIFGTILKGNGNLDSTSAIGTGFTTSDTVYNAAKQAFNINLTYTKTGDSAYSLTYDIMDSSGVSIYSASPAAVELKFNSSTGEIQTVNGQDPSKSGFKISDSANHIDFTLDLNTLTESESAATVSYSLNQKTDIFNTLLRIRDDLNNGIKPSDEDQQMVKDFNSHILDKTTEAGNITNQLTSTQDLLTNQKTVTQDMLASAQEIDVAQAIMDLQNEDYMLQMAYKVSATILPKSLLDYL